MSSKLLKVGVGGSLVTAVCCFTPVLVIVFAGIGLSAAVAYLDIVLFPALAIFLALTGYALWQHRTATANDKTNS